MALQINGNLPR